MSHPFDKFLLPCNIPTQIGNPLAVIKHLVSSPIDEKDETYYTALSKQSHSYNELLFISAKVISLTVQAEEKTEHKPPPTEHNSSTRTFQNTSDSPATMLNNSTQVVKITMPKTLKTGFFSISYASHQMKIFT